MSRLDELYRLRERIDEQIRGEVERLEAHAKRERARLSMLDRRGWAECGTPSGYYRHRRTLKEPACDACKKAHREDEAARKTRAAARRATTPAGLRLVKGDPA